MHRPRICLVVTFSFVAASSLSIRADVRADEKGRVEFAGVLGRVVNVFGGKAAREGVTSMVAVKGDRKARLNEATGQIIDLAEEKIYDLDMKRRTYKVTTFAELRRRMEEAREKADADARQESAKEKPEAAPPPDDRQSQKQIEIDFSVKETGEKKTINGFDTREAVMTIVVREKGKTLDEGGGLVVTSDLWLAPRIAAMKEIADFDLRYARKLEGPAVAGASPEQIAAALAMYPHLKEAIARMNAEGVKLDGTAIQTTTKIDAVKSLEDMRQQQSEQESQPSGGIGGRLLGGLAKKMAQKKAAQSDAANRTMVMTLDAEVLSVTTSVAASDVAVPAGFQVK